MDNRRTSPHEQKKGISRRHFLSSTAAALAGWGLSEKMTTARPRPHISQEPSPGKIKQFRTLGRTGFKVSDISFGSGEISESNLLVAIFEAGVNYVDSSESYGRGQAERIIGRALQNRDRESVFITTKLPLGKDRTKESYLDRARKCLERLQTEYIDCLMMHGPSRAEDLKTEGFHAAIQELKTEGRVRFCGLSNHGSQWGDVPETMEQVLLAAAEDGRFDVMLLVYNFIQREMGANVLKACREKNIGTTLMKTNPVLNYMEVQERNEQLAAEGKPVPDFQKRLVDRLKGVADKAEPFKKELGISTYDEVRTAAIKFALSNPNVNTACITIKNFSDLDFYTALSGQKMSTAELQNLDVYAKTYGTLYCRHACGICESSCPSKVPVNTVMRYQHYFRAQGREKTAMAKYANLPAGNASLCSDCAGHCESACPFGVPIQGLMVAAHDALTLG